MKRLIVSILLILVVLNVYTLERFSEELHHPGVIIVGFDAVSINTRTGDISIQRNRQGALEIGVSSFDALSAEYQFTDLVRMFYANDKDWHDENGQYPMNVFRLYVADNSFMDGALEALQSEPSVIFAEFEGIVKMHSAFPNDPDFSRQWGLHMIEAPELWEYFKGDENIVIGIVDSGTKWNHVDLRDNMWLNPDYAYMDINWTTGEIYGDYGGTFPQNNIFGDVLGWNFSGPENNRSFQQFRGNEHGTHVAGCAGAVGNNGIGVTGVSPIASIFNTRHAPDNREQHTMDRPYDGVSYMIQRGIQVINCSWGGATGNGALSNLLANQALAAGSVLVVAAGNDGEDGIPKVNGSANNWPANALNAIAVGSSNSQDRKANHSDFGPTLAFLSPGQDIYSTYYSGSGNNTNDSYANAMGTSMASPIAAGVAAMVMAMNPHLTAYDIKQRLMDTADPLPNEPLFAQGLIGAGRLNAFKAVMCDYIPRLHISGDVLVEEHEGDGDGLPNLNEIIRISFDIENEAGWSTALGASAVISSTLDGVTIINSEIKFGNLAAGTKNSSEEYFLIRVDGSIGVLDVPVEITVLSNQEATYTYNYSKTYQVNISLTMSKPGWPLATGGESVAAAMVADLDGTGNRMITISNDRVHVTDVNKNYNEGFPVAINGSIATDFAIGDVARNGNQQIVIATTSGRLIVLDHTGKILNERELGHQVSNTPVIADLNNDGYNEIIVSTRNNLFVLDGNTLQNWANFPIAFSPEIIANLAVGDVTGDGIQNIVVPTSSITGAIHVINPLTGQNIPNFPYNATVNNVGPSLVNLSGGNGLDIVFAGASTFGNRLYVLKNDGTIYKEITAPGVIRTEISVLELFRNSVPYLVFGDANGNINVKDKNLENLPGFPINVGSRIDSSPTSADIGHRGYRSIVFGDEQGRIHVIDVEGNYHTGFPLRASRSWIRRSVWVGNFEPGKIAMLYPTITGVDYFDTKRYGIAASWNSYRGNIGKTASYTDYRVPEDDTFMPLLVDALEQNYPNPFNPETNINFSISTLGNVKLNVYNIRGQLVKTLLDENREAGYHTVTWNGTDNYGRNVSSGLYLYRIETNTFSDVKRMMLMK